MLCRPWVLRLGGALRIRWISSIAVPDRFIAVAQRANAAGVMTGWSVVFMGIRELRLPRKVRSLLPKRFCFGYASKLSRIVLPDIKKICIGHRNRLLAPRSSEDACSFSEASGLCRGSNCRPNRKRGGGRARPNPQRGIFESLPQGAVQQGNRSRALGRNRSRRRFQPIEAEEAKRAKKRKKRWKAFTRLPDSDYSYARPSTAAEKGR